MKKTDINTGLNHVICHRKKALIVDIVEIFSITHQKSVKLYIHESNEFRSPIAHWAIGKSIGSHSSFKGNYFEITNILKLGSKEYYDSDVFNS